MIGFNNKSLESCTESVYCNIEIQTKHAWINRLGDFGIEVTNISPNLTVTANYLKNTNFMKDEIPSFMKNFNIKELSEQKSGKDLMYKKTCEIWEIIKSPTTIFTPGTKLHNSNKVENEKMFKNGLSRKMPAGKNTDVIHVATISKNITESEHVVGNIIPTESVGSIITWNIISKIGNPRFLNSTTPENKQNEVIKIENATIDFSGTI